MVEVSQVDLWIELDSVLIYHLANGDDSHIVADNSGTYLISFRGNELVRRIVGCIDTEGFLPIENEIQIP